MSRMIFVFCMLLTVSGCCETVTRRVSLVTARLETLGPGLSVRKCNNGCSDCIPHRPWTLDYFPRWDDHITEHTAQKCAFRAFDNYKSQCGGRRLTHHFKSGFVMAYEDLAFNRRPIPRIVPPPLYWNAFYRSCAGQEYVQDWYAGYEAGIESGSTSGVSRFHEIALRRYGFCGTGGSYGADGYSDDTALIDQGDIQASPVPPVQQPPIGPTPIQVPIQSPMPVPVQSSAIPVPAHYPNRYGI